MAPQRSLSPWAVLALLITMDFMGTFSMVCMPPLFSEILIDIPLSRALMGSLMGVTVLSAIVFAPIGGMLSDRIGCRWAMGLGLFVVAVCGGLRGAANTSYELVACMLGIGVGFNLVVPSLPKVLGQWFDPGKLAFVNGINVAGAGVGGAIGMATAASVLSPALGGWRGVMIATSSGIFLFAIVWVLIYRDPVDENAGQKQKTNMFANFKKVAKLRNIRLLAALSFFQSLGFIPVGAFFPISLEERGIAHAGQLTAIVMGTAVIFNIVGGRISDLLGRRKPIIFLGAFIAGLGILVCGTLSGLPLILVLIITGAAVGSISPIMLTIPIEMEEVGTELAATAVGFVMMFQSFSGFLGPIVTGKLIDMTGYQTGFLFMGGAVIVGSLFALFMKEPRKRRG